MRSSHKKAFELTNTRLFGTATAPIEGGAGLLCESMDLFRSNRLCNIHICMCQTHS